MPLLYSTIIRAENIYAKVAVNLVLIFYLLYLHHNFYYQAFIQNQIFAMSVWPIAKHITTVVLNYLCTQVYVTQTFLLLEISPIAVIKKN